MIFGSPFLGPKDKVAAWVGNFEPVYSKSENFEAEDILNEKYVLLK
jgi:hypothetical protein